MDETSRPQPIYSTPEPNNGIVLAQDEPVRVTAGTNQEDSTARVHLEFLPRPLLLLDLALPWDEGTVAFDKGCDLLLTNRGASASCFCLRATFAGSGSWALTLTPKRQLLVANDPGEEGMGYALFHLLNFHEFYHCSEKDKTDPNHFFVRHWVTLCANGWRITISSHSKTHSLVKALSETGGYALTHVGKIEREGNACFSRSEAEALMEAIYYYLSWARGHWVDAILPVGFGASGNRVWEEWGCRRSSAWVTVRSWFEEQHGNMLEEVFPGFFRRWQDEEWRGSLREAIYWYLLSNAGSSSDAGIVLTQSALELIAWAYAVIDRKLVSSDGFQRLPASDRLRLMLGSLGIPTDIPPSVPEVGRLAQGFGWKDGPQAITEIRNETVHPGHKQRGKFVKAKYDGWRLGQWYVDLALLRLCDHRGEYANRLTQTACGQTEKVPWA